MKKLVIAALFVMGAVALATTTANAEVLGEQEQHQELKQKAKAECKSSYGKDMECEIELEQKAKQSQKQRILGEQVVVKDERVHIPVNTGLDTQTFMAAIGITAMGGVAFVARKKLS